MDHKALRNMRQCGFYLHQFPYSTCCMQWKFNSAVIENKHQCWKKKAPQWTHKPISQGRRKKFIFFFYLKWHHLFLSIWLLDFCCHFVVIFRNNIVNWIIISQIAIHAYHIQSIDAIDYTFAVNLWRWVVKFFNAFSDKFTRQTRKRVNISEIFLVMTNQD